MNFSEQDPREAARMTRFNERIQTIIRYFREDLATATQTIIRADHANAIKEATQR
jgi:hypothetical protein